MKPSEGAHVVRVLDTGNSLTHIDKEVVCHSLKDFLLRFVLDEVTYDDIAYISVSGNVFPSRLVKTMFLAWPSICRIVVVGSLTNKTQQECFLSVASVKGRRFLRACDKATLK